MPTNLKISERVKKSPEFAAWFISFFLKNHLDPFTYPTKVATREQIEFMVHPENNERYYPCSDKMFDAIMSQTYPVYLKKQYEKVFNKAIAMIDELIDSDGDKTYLKTLVKIKYDDEIRTGLLIPSRLEKRLHMIFLSRTHIENPYFDKKKSANRNAFRFLNSETFSKALNHVENSLCDLENSTLPELKEKIKEVEFRRLVSLLSQKNRWSQKKAKMPSMSEFKEIFDIPFDGTGWVHLLELVKGRKQKILWLADESGEVVVDLRIAKFLAGMGHIVIFAVKESPFYTRVCLADTRTDPVLSKEFEGAHFIHEKTISKNSLLNFLKYDKNIYVVSDGTSEDLNLLLASITFSRIFKEVDCVISRGLDQKEKLIDSHFNFTQSIINISCEKKRLTITCKPRHPNSIKFSHHQLEEKADKIIQEMKQAKRKKMTVMFYSGIIGSIPGKIDVAKKIMSTFIDHLHKQSSNLFIINPSNYYEPGMDADDLMYMWEIVQRSGYIDIWRFQTTDDISESFALLNEKVPPEWIGKDSTYSTGCTKEMRIAQDVQKQNSEMQLIGPSLDKFMRRNEYGVGSMYDQRLADF
ncbi:MAG: hypothetical protein KKE62_16810 [Proteobacteria bacterium]|nr:hypothetical protein [Pseudomonadota bacterium]MBU1386381.1 hypothetical protein [Pseudomonadota bacterium]MBU1544492.1 hypothetical protein [Pseudomonadota bacterium]MBU2480329.1 hypothetical protein [Pseudomonadota bacterium]